MRAVRARRRYRVSDLDRDADRKLSVVSGPSQQIWSRSTLSPLLLGFIVRARLRRLRFAGLLTMTQMQNTAPQPAEPVRSAAQELRQLQFVEQQHIVRWGQNSSNRQ